MDTKIPDEELQHFAKALSKIPEVLSIEICPWFAARVVRELIDRRAAEADAGPSLLSGGDLKVRVNDYINGHSGEYISELDLIASIGLEKGMSSLRLIRSTLRELDMTYRGLDLWTEEKP